ncbi:peroxisomal enoyl-CoA-hydratase [Infundibulicybe gibba]|nr:peroxisomal enoyl-CoA-hydratase [Infundibulicybe gibba]
MLTFVRSSFVSGTYGTRSNNDKVIGRSEVRREPTRALESVASLAGDVASTNAYELNNLGLKESIAKLDGSILTLTINRPKARNSFNGHLAAEIIRVFELCDLDDRVRAVILTADPTAAAFCSGADLTAGWNGLWDPESEKEGEHAHRDGGGKVSLSIYRCRKITISAVNGHAAGVGVTGLQLPFDFRFVWAGAKFTMPFVRRGIAGEATSTYLLPQLYHEILPTREGVLVAAKAFAEDLVKNTAQVSIAYTKGLLQHPGDSIEECHINESRALKLLATSSDAIEGVVSFKEKRLPVFKINYPKVVPMWKRIDVKFLKSKL